MNCRPNLLLAIKQIKLESIPSDPLKEKIDSFLASLEREFIYWRDNMITKDSILISDLDPCHILTTKSMPYTNVSEITKDLFLRMVSFVENNDDVDGISLPQLGVPLQGIVCRLSSGIKVFINPHIFSTKGNAHAEFETCLSVVGKSVEIERPSNIKIVYRDLNFRLKNKNFNGNDVRIMMHMIDHLRGKLITN